jgi:hypothetical protein
MNNFSPMVKLSGIMLLIGLVIFGMLAIVLITFVIVRTTSPSPTQAVILFPTTVFEASATPALATAFPPTQTSVPPTFEPLPSATALPEATLPVGGQTLQPAADFLVEYFTSINSRDYTATWAKLSDKYKTAHNPDGYGPYVNFWDTVDRVDVLTPDVVYQKTVTAKVSARLNLAYKNGKNGSQLVTFELIPDDQGVSWLIDDSY